MTRLIGISISWQSASFAAHTPPWHALTQRLVDPMDARMKWP